MSIKYYTIKFMFRNNSLQILLFEVFKIALRAIIIPGLMITGLVLYQYQTWLTRLVELGIGEEFASTMYTKIPMSFLSLLLALFLLICIPLFIGQFALLNYLIMEVKMMKIDLKNRKTSRKKRSSKDVKPQINSIIHQRFDLLFFGLYIPKVGRDFKIWYHQSFNTQSLFLFGFGILFAVISQIQPYLAWANFAREYAFTLLMINLLALIAERMFYQLRSPSKSVSH